MATKRDVKKDIAFFTEEVVSDCLNFLVLHNERDNTDVLSIIENMEDLYEEMISRVNHIDGKNNHKMIKSYFNSLYEDLLDAIEEAFSQLSEIAKKNVQA
ncbi:MAG: hypothetical protein PHR53_03045 [Bacteroidales bacterium]|nr:hypothetical protein [Bacteroidales bacterium]